MVPDHPWWLPHSTPYHGYGLREVFLEKQVQHKMRGIFDFLIALHSFVLPSDWRKVFMHYCFLYLFCRSAFAEKE